MKRPHIATEPIGTQNKLGSPKKAQNVVFDAEDVSRLNIEFP
jgi:hypothetical protein